jgi:hypothetical protein
MNLSMVSKLRWCLKMVSRKGAGGVQKREKAEETKKKKKSEAQ